MASINADTSPVYDGASVFKTLLISFIKLMSIGLYFFTYFLIKTERSLHGHLMQSSF